MDLLDNEFKEMNENKDGKSHDTSTSSMTRLEVFRSRKKQSPRIYVYMDMRDDLGINLKLTIVVFGLKVYMAYFTRYYIHGVSRS